MTQQPKPWTLKPQGVTLDQVRATFVHWVAKLSPDLLHHAIRDQCAAGLGYWLTPATATETARPTTHLFEISLFGIFAVGTTPEQAAMNWRNIATAQMQADALADPVAPT